MHQLPTGDLQNIPPAAVDVIYCDEQGAAVRFARDGVDWMLIEEYCIYSPMPYEEAEKLYNATYGDDRPEGEETLYMTTANHIIIDLTHSRIMRQYFSADGRSIQGLVYAIDALQHGGNLKPSGYEDYIRNCIIPPDFQLYSEVDLIEVERIVRELAARCRQ